MLGGLGGELYTVYPFCAMPIEGNAFRHAQMLIL